ncbi:hypothetical protein CK203_031075 [Vitis vinifera]|uniref:Retrovirus-related Pol polyprotein from transposon TNT 1-94 n=1 Tax=Vitis vinifera TaxID=29760 RepID=A0A438J0Q8_VITVI|nr:hypothetical protein CK203_031075 [Vitis vinifera]
MEGETIKIMNQDLVRLDRFDGSNFTRWQDKVRFLLTALKIFYILDPTLAPLPEPKENDTPQVVAARKKREEDECGPAFFTLLIGKVPLGGSTPLSPKEVSTD